MSEKSLWNYDQPLENLGIEPPPWIDEFITGSDLAAILQGGCASGAYMPAVTYHAATGTMSLHGDSVLEFIDDHYGHPGFPTDAVSWSGLACHFLSIAVELWASSVELEAEEALEGID